MMRRKRGRRMCPKVAHPQTGGGKRVKTAAMEAQ
jgi:hypothetical protein